MEKLVQCLNFSYKSSLKKARRLLDDGEELKALTWHINKMTAIVKDYSVCLSEDSFSCGCIAGRTARLCYHVIFFFLYFRENEYSMPKEIIKGMTKYVESRYGH